MRIAQNFSLLQAHREWCIAIPGVRVPVQQMAGRCDVRRWDRALLRPFPEEHHPYRFGEDQQVENQRVVLDIEKVELKLALRILDRGAVRVTNLRPPSQARLDAVPHVVEAHLLAQLFDESRPFRSRTDEAHVAIKDVDQLRQLVDAKFAQDAADAAPEAGAGARPRAGSLS